MDEKKGFNLDEELKFIDITRAEPSLSEQIEKAKIEDLPELVGRVALGAECATEREALLQAIAKKFKVPLRALREDVGIILPSTRNETREKDVNLCAILPGLVDLVLDEKGRVAYLFHGGDKAGLYMADEYTDDRGRFVPPKLENLPFPLVSGPEVLKAYDAGENPAGLFNDVLHYLRRFSYLPDRDFLLLGLYPFLTHIQDHPEISYIPIILFWAVPERGKTRTAKPIVYASYRGSHRVDMREANLFRDSENIHATIFLDVQDVSKKAEANSSSDILLMRYERGAKVGRVLWPDRGPFLDTRYYDIFGPTIIATNEPTHKILGSRCIPFTMPNRPGQYEDPSPEKGIPLRVRLTAWRASMMDVVLKDVEPVTEITGRLWDISRPLLMVAGAVCPHRYDAIVEALIEKARERVEEKRETLEGLIVRALVEISPNPPEAWEIRVDDLLAKVNEALPEQYRKTPQWLGRRLKALSIPGRIIGGYSKVPMNRSTLITLAEQYGVENNIPTSPPKNSQNSCNSISEEKTDTCGHEFSMRVGETHEKLMRNSCSEHTENTNEKGFHEFHEFSEGVPGKEIRHEKQTPLFEVE